MPLTYYKNARGAPKYRLSANNNPHTLLLGEGDAEAMLFECILTMRGASAASNHVYCFEGVNKLQTALKYLTSEPNWSGVRNLGILIDADQDPLGRTASIAASLQNTGCMPPGTNLVNGAYPGAHVHIQALISPFGNRTGAIDDVVLTELRPKGDYLCVQQLADCERQRTGQFPVAKALVGAYISLSKPGMCGVHRGFESGLFDVMHAAYQPVRDLVDALQSP